MTDRRDNSGKWTNRETYLPIGEVWVIAENNVSLDDILKNRETAVYEAKLAIYNMTVGWQ